MNIIIVNELKSEIRNNCVKNPLRSPPRNDEKLPVYKHGISVDFSGYTSDEGSGKMSNLTVNDLPSDGDESFGNERSGSRRGRNSIGGNSDGDGASYILVSGFPYAESEANVFNFLLEKIPNALSIHVPTDGDDEKIKEWLLLSFAVESMHTEL